MLHPAFCTRKRPRKTGLSFSTSTRPKTRPAHSLPTQPVHCRHRRTVCRWRSKRANRSTRSPDIKIRHGRIEVLMPHNSTCKGNPGVDRAPVSTDCTASPSLIAGAAAPSTVADLSGRLMASYVLAGGINHVDGNNLPSKQAIAGITADLLRLLFPGFFDEEPIHSSEIRGVTNALLD